MINRSILFSIVLFLLGVLPQTMSMAQSVQKIRSPILKLKKENPLESRFQSQFRIENQQYMIPVNNSADLTSSTYLSGGVEYDQQINFLGKSRFKLDLYGGTFFNKTLTHLVVKETYFSSATTKEKNNDLRTSFSVGRILKDWNEFDRDQNLALWEPRYAVDALRPVEQGLTGFFVNFDQPSWDLTIFSSPVFIPSMSAEVREENGSLVSDSRWYKAPSSKFNMLDSTNNPISYNLNIPELAKLVDNWSLGALLMLNPESSPWRFNFGFADKPVNDLLLKRKINVDTQNKALVEVAPDVTRHTIMSFSAKYLVKDSKTILLSYIEDKPLVKLPEFGWATQKLNPLKVYGITFSSPYNLFNSTLTMNVSRMKSFGGDIQDILFDGTLDDNTLFDHRLRFRDTTELKMNVTLEALFKKKALLTFSYLYDHYEVGQMLMSEFQYSYSKNTNFIAGFDVLGVDASESKSSGFLNQFRANDRVFGGMSYVF